MDIDGEKSSPRTAKTTTTPPPTGKIVPHGEKSSPRTAKRHAKQTPDPKNTLRDEKSSPRRARGRRATVPGATIAPSTTAPKPKRPALCQDRPKNQTSRRAKPRAARRTRAALAPSTARNHRAPTRQLNDGIDDASSSSGPLSSTCAGLRMYTREVTRSMEPWSPYTTPDEKSMMR